MHMAATLQQLAMEHAKAFLFGHPPSLPTPTSGIKTTSTQLQLEGSTAEAAAKLETEDIIIAEAKEVLIKIRAIFPWDKPLPDRSDPSQMTRRQQGLGQGRPTTTTGPTCKPPHAAAGRFREPRVGLLPHVAACRHTAFRP